MTAATRIDVHADQDELPSLEEVRALFEERYNIRPKLIGRDGAIDLPDSLYCILREVVPLLLQQRPVSILAADEELTTQQAADILNVSRQHVVDLITAGDLPAHMVGTHRRILARDLLEFREHRRSEQDAALDDLARLSYEEGMYDKRPKRT